MDLVNYTTEILIIFIFIFLIAFHSTSFEIEYSNKLVNLYMNPLWRLLIVGLVIAAAMWSPRIGILVAFATFLYFSDVGALITPFVVGNNESYL